MDVFTDEFRDRATVENLKELISMLKSPSVVQFDDAEKILDAAETLLGYYGIPGVDFPMESMKYGV